MTIYDEFAERIRAAKAPLRLRGGGTKVATVTADGHIHLIPVTVGRDMGATVQITSGLSTSVKIVRDPADSIEEGQQVHIGGNNG